MEVENQTVQTNATAEDKNTSTKNKSWFRQLIETILYFAVILTVVLLVQRFIVQPVEVNGSSMEVTLSDGDHLLLEKVTYAFSEPKRFDVIVFQPYDYDSELYYIKRIIGLPGETVKIEDNCIYIDGVLLDETYGKENVIRDPGIASEGITLGADEYFVLGDNRNNSKDSRDSGVGNVTRDSILGRAWCRIWPLHDFGVIKHE